MDYDNYDAFGNKINSSTTTTTVAEVVEERPQQQQISQQQQPQKSANNRNKNDDSDDEWGDVEIIDNQAPTDDISVPLVQSAGYNGHLQTAHDGAVGEILMITAGSSAGQQGAGGQQSANKSESQKHADAINFIVSGGSAAPPRLQRVNTAGSDDDNDEKDNATDAAAGSSSHDDNVSSSSSPRLTSSSSSSMAKIRNVCLVGDIHSGKSSMARLLATAAAEVEGQFDELTAGKTAKQRHFGTSSSPKAAAASALIPFQALAEQEHGRLTTIRNQTFSCLVSGEKTMATHLVTITDTPGHPSFIADALSGVRVADTLLVCVDASACLGSHTEQIIRRAVLQQIRIVLVLTKLDRLLIDLHLPPQNAYFKLRTIIDSVNNVIASCGGGSSGSGVVSPLVSPLNNTVWFTSAKMNLFFTLESFARKYSRVYKSIDVATLASRLWGPIRFDSDARKFTKVTMPTQRPSFVTLILEPLYKVVSHSIGGEGYEILNEALSAAPKSPWTAVREAVTLYCGSFHKLAVDALLSSCEAPLRRNSVLRTQYQIDVDDGGAPLLCASAIVTGVLIVPTSRIHGGNNDSNASTTSPNNTNADDAETTFVLARVINGVLKKNDVMNIVDQKTGASSTSEDVAIPSAAIEGIFVRTAVGLVEVPDALAGMSVYLKSKGIANRISGPHALLVASQTEQAFPIPSVPSVFGGMAPPPPPLTSSSSSSTKATAIPSSALETPMLHISVQPLVNAKDLKAFEKGVRKMTLKYPGISVGMEETGMYTVSGMGELQFEAALTDLRRYDTKHLPPNAIKLSSFVDNDNAQPFVTFSETVAERDGNILAVHPPSRHRNDQLAMTAQRMPDKLTEAIQFGLLPINEPPREDGLLPLFTCLRREHGWDIFAASRGLISIGPDMIKGGSSILVDDSLEGDWLDNFESAECVVEGFNAATARGPLCDAEVRGVQFKLIDGAVPFSQHLVQHARLCAHKALLGASPRLMEPIFLTEIVTQPTHVERIKKLFELKRGNIVSELKIPASPLVICKGYCPAIDHFGLETTMRVETNGEAFPTFTFDHWAMIDSDPYDATIPLELLTPARGHKLARDFVLKTRMRKGLRPKPEEIDLQ